ncbi:Thioredoxin-like [Hortaea werneckii]|nr:Thioredoxin-like [Hortaea werneckii]
MADALKHPTSLPDLRNLFSSTTYVAIDFSAEWCGPCKVIGPVFANLASKHSLPGHLAFAKVDVDAARDIAQQYGISAMPTFMFFKEGKQVGVNGKAMIQGADVKSLNAAVEKLDGLAKKRAQGS